MMKHIVKDMLAADLSKGWISLCQNTRSPLKDFHVMVEDLHLKAGDGSGGNNAKKRRV